MNNEYICELNIELDLFDIDGIVNGVLKPHQRLVENNPSLVLLRKKFPFLGSIYNIYVFPPKIGLPVHIDSFRKCAINFPIKNTLESTTIFYKSDEPLSLKHVESKSYDLVLSNKTEVFRFTLEHPTLINNMIPHNAMNFSTSPRVVLSWGIDNNIDYNTAKELLSDYIL
jgi:hypothetical protein